MIEQLKTTTTGENGTSLNEDVDVFEFGENGSISKCPFRYEHNELENMDLDEETAFVGSYEYLCLHPQNNKYGSPDNCSDKCPLKGKSILIRRSG